MPFDPIGNVFPPRPVRKQPIMDRITLMGGILIAAGIVGTIIAASAGIAGFMIASSMLGR